MINNELPAHDVAEFIAYTKSRPDPISIASSGIGTSLYLSGELFKAMAGVSFTHGPYRGSAPGLAEMMCGQIQGMFVNVTSSFAFVRGGKLRALGVTTRKRSEILPGMKPISDTLPFYETSSFYRVGAPRKTAREIVDVLNSEINAALADPLIGQRMAEFGAIPLCGNADEFRAMLAVETERWRKVVELSGARKG